MSQIPLVQLTPTEQLLCLSYLTEVKDRVDLRAGTDTEPLKPDETSQISIIRKNLPKDVSNNWTLSTAAIYTYKRELFTEQDLIEELNLDYPEKKITCIRVCIKRSPRGGWKALHGVTLEECIEYRDKGETARLKPQSPKKKKKNTVYGKGDLSEYSSSGGEEEEDGGDVEVIEIPELAEHLARKRARGEEEEEEVAADLPLPPPPPPKEKKLQHQPLSTTTTSPPLEEVKSPYLPPLTVPVSLRKHSSSTGSLQELQKQKPGVQLEWNQVYTLQEKTSQGEFHFPVKEGVEARYNTDFFLTPRTVLVKANDRPTALYTTQQVTFSGFILKPHDKTDCFTCPEVDPLKADIMVLNELGFATVDGWNAKMCVVDLKQMKSKLMEDFYEEVASLKETLKVLGVHNQREEAELYIIQELLQMAKVVATS